MVSRFPSHSFRYYFRQDRVPRAKYATTMNFLSSIRQEANSIRQVNRPCPPRPRTFDPLPCPLHRRSGLCFRRGSSAAAHSAAPTATIYTVSLHAPTPSLTVPHLTLRPSTTLQWCASTVHCSSCANSRKRRMTRVLTLATKSPTTRCTSSTHSSTTHPLPPVHLRPSQSIAGSSQVCCQVVGKRAVL